MKKLIINSILLILLNTILKAIDSYLNSNDIQYHIMLKSLIDNISYIRLMFTFYTAIKCFNNEYIWEFKNANNNNH